MSLTAFDHVNLRTARLDEMIAWYGAVLDLHPGPRPDFGFPGAWLYLGDTAVVHLVGVPGPVGPAPNISLEHFAFRAKGISAFKESLEAHGVGFSQDAVPGFPLVQLNFRDPDGNHIHVDFDTAELAG